MENFTHMARDLTRPVTSEVLTERRRAGESSRVGDLQDPEAIRRAFWQAAAGETLSLRRFRRALALLVVLCLVLAAFIWWQLLA